MDDERIDWSPTTAQKVGAGIGLAIGSLTWFRDDLPVWVKVAFPIAYAVACAVIPRFRGVARYRRTKQFAAHQVAMATIAFGWLVTGSTQSALINATWLAVAGVWWVVAGRSD